MPREVNSNADSEGNLRVGIFYTLFDFTNFLFANTPKGATGSAVMFSLIQTAIENGLDPSIPLPDLADEDRLDAGLSQVDTIKTLLP